jgi:transketolase
MKIGRKELEEIARKIRIESIKMVYKAQSGHSGGPLSAAEIIAVLYWRFLRIRPQEPSWPDRDRFVLSKGHSCPALYAALALKGFFERSHLDTLRKYGTILQGHPSMKHTPGLDMSTGSLGQGLSAACGMALGAKHQGKSFRVYALLSDGEQDEGMTWEAAMFAHHYHLDNLTAIVDFNGLQLDGYNREIMDLDPLPEKWKAFGWHVQECNGHDVEELSAALNEAIDTPELPSLIIAHTVKGKGVSYMEDVCEWHGAVPNAEEFEQAMKELGAAEELKQ